jgi:mono/diheme cytochrome c family protein
MSLMSRRHASIWVGACAGLALLGQQAPAQEIGDAPVGHQIAQTWCVNCHVVEPTQAQASSTGAPPFAAVAAMKSATPMAFRVFLQTPHERMPDLHLSRAEIDDVIAYIMSLKR